MPSPIYGSGLPSTSTGVAGVITDETGTGALVFANTPTLVTPILGTPTSGNLSNCTSIPAANLSGTTMASNVVTSSLTTIGTLVGGSALQSVTEASSNPVTDDGTTITQTGAFTFFVFFNLPSTEKLYRITGIEWKNGATAAGTVNSGIIIPDASPPSGNGILTAVWSLPTAASGTNAVQRNSTLSFALLPAGTLVGVAVGSTSATHTFKASTVTNNNNKKAVTAATALGSFNDVTAWTASTTQPYIKVYYVGYK